MWEWSELLRSMEIYSLDRYRICQSLYSGEPQVNTPCTVPALYLLIYSWISIVLS
jgi:hypothetical protein